MHDLANKKIRDSELKSIVSLLAVGGGSLGTGLMFSKKAEAKSL